MGDDAMAKDGAHTERDRPDFSGKVVVFYLANAPRDSESGVVMEYVEFRRFQGRWFLTGRVPEYVDFQWASRLQLALEGAALFYEAGALWGYAGGFLVLTHLLVVLYEEPTLRRTFAEDYETYCRQVRRWWPTTGATLAHREPR